MLRHRSLWRRVDTLALLYAPLGTDACWRWPFGANDSGYGQVRQEGRMVYVHRLSYAHHHGDPGDLHVIHLCDQPGCFRPDHLRLGTQQDNMRDAAAKGRLPNQRKQTCPRGHPYDDIGRRGDGRLFRVCGECRRASARRRKTGRKEPA